MPRRIYSFQPDRGLELWNLLSSSGVPLQAAGVLLIVWNLLRSLRKGAIAGNDPWDAWTLEWATTSPPPEHNFEIDAFPVGDPYDMGLVEYKGEEEGFLPVNPRSDDPCVADVEIDEALFTPPAAQPAHA